MSPLSPSYMYNAILKLLRNTKTSWLNPNPGDRLVH